METWKDEKRENVFSLHKTADCEGSANCLFMRNKCVDQAALELKDPLASLSHVLKLKVSVTMLSLELTL